MEQTEKLIESVLKIDSKNPDALMLKFNILKKKGELEEAIETAEKISSIDPKIVSAVYTDYANALMDKGQFHKAKKILKKAISRCKENVDAVILLGDAELKDEKYEDAIEDYFSAVNQNPAYTTQVLPKLENAFYQNNTFDEYSTRLREELSERTDNSDMHYELGKFLKKRRLVNEAKEAFKRALEFNPTHLEAREELLAILFDEKNLDKIKSEFRDFFSEIRKNTFYFCNKCSNREKTLVWKCPSCGTFNSYEKGISLF